jgi:hypothetical protein
VTLKIDRATCEVAKGYVVYKLLKLPKGIFSKVKIPLLALANTGDSIRIATFNTQFLPSTVYEKDPKDAERMAKRIIASGYDFIVLNEVFDDEAGESFTKHLKSDYPYYIQELDGDTVFAEQSGLAIYSRFPMIDLLNPGCDGDSCGGDCIGSVCDKVAFWVYHVCDDTAWPWDIADCDSDKGMALVRIRNPHTNRVYNTFFTHLQASYFGADTQEDVEEHFETRKEQLRYAVDLLNDHLTEQQYTREDVFLMGDLNVDGNLNNAVFPLGIAKNKYEWRYHFELATDHLNGFYIDPWEKEQSPAGADPGLTNGTEYAQAGGGGARLDYIARHAPDSPPQAVPGIRDLCFQHMTLAYNLFWADKPGDYSPKGLGMGGIYSLSDHYGVNADINRWAPQCRPVEAATLAPPPGTPGVHPGTIVHPGSMQWWKVEAPGTYSIALLDPAALAVTDDFVKTIYQAKDLSTPVGPYKQETTEIQVPGIHGPITADKFEILQPPFYVRVQHRYRTATGGYRLVILKHDCTTKQQSCTLRPGTTKAHVLPPVWLGTPDEAWFDLDTEKIPAGVAPQQLVFRMSGIDPSVDGTFVLRLLADDGVTLVRESQATASASDGTLQIAFDTLTKAKSKHYLTVGRNGGPSFSAPAETDFAIRWTTNLSVLYGGSEGLTLQCAEENDDPSSEDEVLLGFVKRDGETTIVNKWVETAYETGIVRDVSKLLKAPVYFYDQLQIRFIEEDDLSGNDFADFFIAALDPEDSLPLENHPQTAPFDTGGLYVLKYSLAHWLPD